MAIKTMGEMIDFLIKAEKSNHQKIAKKAYINSVIKETGKSREEATRIVNANMRNMNAVIQYLELIKR